jgi:hypothetical protein
LQGWPPAKPLTRRSKCNTHHKRRPIRRQAFA